VLFHLIDNSVEHGFVEKVAGLISINATKKNGNIVLDYQDNGIGITDSQKTKIFEPFYSTKRNSKNIGLGLNIVNNIITQTMHGNIKLIPSPIGIRYQLTFPCELS
jgi:signal transduction histidine kinase